MVSVAKGGPIQHPQSDISRADSSANTGPGSAALLAQSYKQFTADSSSSVEILEPQDSKRL